MDTNSGRVPMHTAQQPSVRCSNCGSDNIRKTDVKSAFWHDERLVVVEDVPAVICEDCHERYFDDHTVVLLDLLRSDGFPFDRAIGELRVPVFSFRDRADAKSES